MFYNHDPAGTLRLLSSTFLLTFFSTLSSTHLQNYFRILIFTCAPLSLRLLILKNRVGGLGDFSCVQLFATLWTKARQAPLSMGFSRQEYQSGLPWPPPGDFPNPGIKPVSLALAGGFFTTSASWEARICLLVLCISSLVKCLFKSFVNF